MGRNVLLVAFILLFAVACEKSMSSQDYHSISEETAKGNLIHEQFQVRLAPSELFANLTTNYYLARKKIVIEDVNLTDLANGFAKDSLVELCKVHRIEMLDSITAKYGYSIEDYFLFEQEIDESSIDSALFDKTMIDTSFGGIKESLVNDLKVIIKEMEESMEHIEFQYISGE